MTRDKYQCTDSRTTEPRETSNHELSKPVTQQPIGCCTVWLGIMSLLEQYIYIKNANYLAMVFSKRDPRPKLITFLYTDRARNMAFHVILTRVARVNSMTIITPSSCAAVLKWVGSERVRGIGMEESMPACSLLRHREWRINATSAASAVSQDLSTVYPFVMDDHEKNKKITRAFHRDRRRLTVRPP